MSYINNVEQIVSTNINTNLVDDVNDNELKFDSSNSLENNHVEDPLPVVIIGLRASKNYRQTLNSGLTFFWDIVSTDSMIKRNHVNHFKSKLRYNKVEYNTAYWLYKNTHDVKVPFSMPEFSNRKIITHCFHIENAQSGTGIVYEMIIVCELMEQIFLKASFGSQILEWGKTEITTKYPDNFLVQPDLTKCYMGNMVIDNSEPYSTRQTTERVVKIFNSTYARYNLDKVAAAASKLDKNQRKKH